MERIFTCMDRLGPIHHDTIVQVSNELAQAGNLTEAVHHLYEVVKVCPVVEEVITVPHSAMKMIQSLEEITQDLFEFVRMHKTAPKTRKNSINRVDFLFEMAKHLVYLHSCRDMFGLFLKRTFGSLNDTLNSHINTNTNNESSFGALEGGNGRKNRKQTRSHSRKRKLTRRS